ncbi:MAG: GNAT family N-acetyltransferase [Promethearchaeota archaeon]|jgi:RimJ/RimL family protein N-acetyltransferase
MRAPERLVTRRLILRKYRKDDFKDFYELIRNQDVINNLNIKSEYQTSDEANALFSTILNSYGTSGNFLALAISKKEEEDFLGTCGIKSQKSNLAVSCFYALLPLNRSYGFAIEAMLKLFEYAFEVLTVPKIVIYIHPNSSDAWKVAERIGMKYLGQLKRENFIPHAMLFSIDKEEYSVQRAY